MAALLIAPAAHAQQSPEHSAEAVASAVLHAYRAQDITQLMAHMNETNQSFVEAYAENPDQFEEMFTGTRSQAGVMWDGFIFPARYSVEPDGTWQAVIPFAVETTSGFAPLADVSAGRLIAVVLTLDSPEDTTWGFEDVNYIPRSTYTGLLDAL
ncbi:hypothetical protein A8B78_15755 [Jannaschia sp. EhC01]|nr:hypothetical protein A8B78_15755 [Jannaschia sp. EhC01]